MLIHMSFVKSLMICRAVQGLPFIQNRKLQDFNSKCYSDGISLLCLIFLSSECVVGRKHSNWLKAMKRRPRGQPGFGADDVNADINAVVNAVSVHEDIDK